MVIHGIGEQRPMDTITDFVRAVWETDPDVCRNGKPLPAETWSKPDVRTGSLELRRITTRESTPTPAFPRGARSDFYELYWADLSAGSTWDEVRSWVAGLLCRNPFTSVPRDVMLAWIALWVLCPGDPRLACRKRAAEGRHDLSNPIPRAFGHCLSCFGGRRGSWPQSLPFWPGSRTASLFPMRDAWCAIRGRRRTTLPRARTFGNEGSRCSTNCIGKIISASSSSATASVRSWPMILSVTSGQGATRAARSLKARQNSRRCGGSSSLSWRLRRRPRTRRSPHFVRRNRTSHGFFGSARRPRANEPDARWLITDLVTLGSPLAHADFLLAKSAKEMDERILHREFPTCPPVREVLDNWSLDAARKTDLPLDDTEPKLLCFPLGRDRAVAAPSRHPLRSGQLDQYP